MKFILIILMMLTASIAQANSYNSCSAYRDINNTISCDDEFSGLQKDVCEVCREQVSCFMALDNKRQRGLCEAYVEGRSCFMALNNSDRHWCQVLVEGKDCSILRSDVDRYQCKNSYFPSQHFFWLY